MKRQKVMLAGLLLLFSLFLPPVSVFAEEEQLACEENLSECYEEALSLFNSKDYKRAEDLFEKIIAVNVNYKKSSFYLTKCRTEITKLVIKEKAQAQKEARQEERQTQLEMKRGTQGEELGARSEWELKGWQQEILAKQREEQKQIDLEARRQKQELMAQMREEQKRVQEETRKQKQELLEKSREEEGKIFQEAKRRQEILMELKALEEQQRETEAQRRREALLALEREEQRQREIESRKRQELLSPLMREEQKQREMESKRKQEMLLALEREEQKQRENEERRRKELLYGTRDLGSIQTTPAAKTATRPLPSTEPKTKVTKKPQTKPIEEYPAAVETMATDKVRPIAKGDTLHISVSKIPDLDKTVTVKTDGTITYPLIGNVKATGMTVNELTQKLTDTLKNYIKEPKVTVKLQQSAHLTSSK